MCTRAERLPIQTERRRDCRRAPLAPDPRHIATVFQQQVRHAKERLTEDAAGDAAGNLVVA
jgi:hypothetical protein